MTRDEVYIEFAIKILEIISRDELTNPGAMNRLKLYYAKVQDDELQDAVLDFCDSNGVGYSISYVPKSKKHTAIFDSYSWTNMPEIKIKDEDLTYAMVQGCLKVYDRLQILK